MAGYQNLPMSSGVGEPRGWWSLASPEIRTGGAEILAKIVPPPLIVKFHTSLIQSLVKPSIFRLFLLTAQISLMNNRTFISIHLFSYAYHSSYRVQKSHIGTTLSIYLQKRHAIGNFHLVEVASSLW